MERILWFILGSIFGTLLLAFNLWLHNETSTAVRQQAIDAGAAYWTVDEQTGVTEFKWRTCDE